MARTSIATAHTVSERNPASQSGAKVTIGCKMPNGLKLRVFEMKPFSEPVMGGGVRESKVAHLKGAIHVNGNAKRIEDQFGCEVVGGYAMTPNVDKDAWDRWLADNEDSPMVTNGLIFAHEDHGDAVAEAKVGKKVRSNMEPMEQDPADDPRTPKGGPVRIERGDRD